MFEVMADYHDKLDERRIDILKDLVKYRALTTEQIKRKFFNNKGNYVNNILVQMRKRGYIKSDTLIGSRSGKKGYTFHKITESGIDVLYANGVEYEEEIYEPYLRQNQLRYVISANEVFLHLESNGWQAYDSRIVKNEYGLDRRDQILGEVISPDGQEKYGLYILERNADVKTIGRIQHEIITNGQSLKNFLVLAKGKQSYNKFIEFGKEKGLNIGGNIKLISLKMGLEILNTFHHEREWIEALCDYYHLDLLAQNNEKESGSQSFPYIIHHNGEEKYLVDLSFSDLSTTHSLNAYIDSGYRWEKRPVLITYMMEQSISGVTDKAMTIATENQISFESFNEIVGSQTTEILNI